MRYVLIVFLIISAAAGVQAQEVMLTGPDVEGMVEGTEHLVAWQVDGVESIMIIAHGMRTPVGKEQRGRFEVPIVEYMPADSGEVWWVVPWIDSLDFFITVIGYDSQGQEVASDSRAFRFRPAVLADRFRDGIYLDLSKRVNQRLYYQKGGRITHAYLSSSSAEYQWRARNSHTKAPHDHAGVFKVLDKKRNHYSSLFRVDMPWAMRYHGGHFIHATSPNQYFALGGPASSGCNRLTWTDAKELYDMTPVGTRVEVIGPNG